MLKEIFNKPQWKHRDPAIRAQAVAELSGPETEEVLAQIVENDDAPEVRRQAVRRMQSLDRLANLAKNDDERNVRNDAAERLRALLTGSAADSPSLEQRLLAVENLANESLIDFLARNASDQQIRGKALEKVTHPRVLADIAVTDPSSDLRSAALGRVDEEDLLRRIVERSRKKDKTIHRAAEQKLLQLRLDRGDPEAVAERREEICRQVERRAWSLDENDSDPTLQDIIFEWRQLPVAADDELQQRFERLCQLGRNASASVPSESSEAGEVSRKDAKEAEASLIEEWLTRLQATVTQVKEGNDATPSAAGPGSELIEAAQSAWSKLETSSDDDSRFVALIHELAAAPSSQDPPEEQASDAPKAADLVRQAQGWLSSKKPLRHGQLARLKGAIDRIGVEEKEERNQLAELLLQIEKRFAEDGEKNEKALEELRNRLSEATRLIEEGELREARLRHFESVQQFRSLSGLSSTQERRIRRQLGRLNQRIQELKNWQHWGNTQQRIRLCEQIEVLIDQQLEPIDLNRRIKAARKEWMDLEASEKLDLSAPHHASGPGLWRRFHAACNRAYEPCKDFFKQKAEEREARLTAFKELCDRLEKAQLDEDPTDWKPIKNLIREGGRALRDVGRIEPKQRGPIAKRIRSALAGLDSRLKPLQQQNEAEKRRLIEQVKQLESLPTFKETLARVREIQNAWRNCGTTDRRSEQALWKEFREACSQILEMQAKRRDEQARQRQEGQGQLNDLCRKAKQLAERQDLKLEEATRQMQDLRQAWDDLGVDERRLRARFEDSLRRIERRSQGARREEARAQKLEQEKNRRKALLKKADLCREIEASSITSDDLEKQVGAWEEQWAKLPRLERNFEASMRSRFEAACQALKKEGDDAAKAHDQNLEAADLLCVRMELLAGIDSPKKSEKVRSRYQMSRLSAALARRETPPPPRIEAEEIRRTFYLTGPLPPKKATAFQRRFNKAEKALLKKLSS